MKQEQWFGVIVCIEQYLRKRPERFLLNSEPFPNSELFLWNSIADIRTPMSRSGDTAAGMSSLYERPTDSARWLSFGYRARFATSAGETQENWDSTRFSTRAHIERSGKKYWPSPRLSVLSRPDAPVLNVYHSREVSLSYLDGINSTLGAIRTLFKFNFITLYDRVFHASW
jgi:hypothetical protein